MKHFFVNTVRTSAGNDNKNTRFPLSNVTSGVFKAILAIVAQTIGSIAGSSSILPPDLHHENRQNNMWVLRIDLVWWVSYGQLVVNSGPVIRSIIFHLLRRLELKQKRNLEPQ